VRGDVSLLPAQFRPVVCPAVTPFMQRSSRSTARLASGPMKTASVAHSLHVEAVQTALTGDVGFHLLCIKIVIFAA